MGFLWDSQRQRYRHIVRSNHVKFQNSNDEEDEEIDIESEEEESDENDGDMDEDTPAAQSDNSSVLAQLERMQIQQY